MAQQEVETLASDSVQVLSPEDSGTELARDPEDVLSDWYIADTARDETDPAAAQSIAAAPAPREIAFEGTLRINGYVAGVVRSNQGSLIVDAAGEVDADIFVNFAKIYGCVRGDIRAKEKVELGGSARVIGDIETVALSIEPGAVFEGRCIFTQPATLDGDG